MFPCEDSKTLSVCPSVCPHPEKRYHHSFVNISPTLVIDTSMERSSRVLHLGNPKIWFFSKKFEIRILIFDEELKSPQLRQYQSYISNWYINGKVFTSTTPWKPTNLIFFQKSSKFEFWLLTKSWNHLSFVNISPTLVIDTSMEWSSRVLHHGNPKKMWFFFQKVGNRRNWILSVPRVSVRREKKLPWLCQYQSYISNWYVNGKVFTSTTTWEPKIWFFFSRKFEIEFDLCWRAEINIQVGLTYMSTSGMHRRPFEGRHLVDLHFLY